MKNKIIIAAIALMSTQAFAADLRDASFKASTNVSNIATDKGKSSIDQTMKVADATAKNLKALISKQMASSTKASGHIGRAIVKVSEVSKPVFKLTGKGIAMAFELSGQTAEASFDVTKKLVILLDPSSEATGEALSFIFEKMSDGTEISSDVSSKIIKPLSKGTEISSDVSTKILEILSKVLDKPLELTSDGISQITRLLSKASDASSKVTNAVIGEDNIENGLDLTGNGISLTSKGIGSVFYVITKGVTGITELFELNKEEIQKAVERNDQDTLAGLRELIRAEINKTIDGGEVLNQLLSDTDLDMYIELRLQASEGI